MDEPGNDRWTPARIARLLGWLTAIAFVGATVIFFLLAYDVTAPAFQEDPGRDFVDTIIAIFQNEQARWPQEVVASLLFAAGFMLLVALAWLLRYGFGRDDVRAGLASSALAVGGFLGAASQLIYLGAKQVAIDPHYCDCVYAPEQIISQHRALALADGTQRWLIMGFLLIAAIGLYLFGRLAQDRGVGGPWAAVSFVGAAVSIVDLIAAAFELDLLFQIGLALSAILIAVWALMVERVVREAPTRAAAV